MTSFKEKQNFIKFDLRSVSVKKTKKHKRLLLRLEALYLVKIIFCLYFSPIPKLWSRKKVIFKVFSFWRYSKILKLLQKVENSYAIIKKKKSPAGRFFERFAHFSPHYNFFTLIWGLLWIHPIDLWHSMLKTLEIHRKSRQ